MSSTSGMSAVRPYAIADDPPKPLPFFSKKTILQPSAIYHSLSPQNMGGETQDLLVACKLNDPGILGEHRPDCGGVGLHSPGVPRGCGERHAQFGVGLLLDSSRWVFAFCEVILCDPTKPGDFLGHARNWMIFGCHCDFMDSDFFFFGGGFSTG